MKKLLTFLAITTVFSLLTPVIAQVVQAASCEFSLEGGNLVKSGEFVLISLDRGAAGNYTLKYYDSSGSLKLSSTFRAGVAASDSFSPQASIPSGILPTGDYTLKMETSSGEVCDPTGGAPVRFESGPNTTLGPLTDPGDALEDVVDPAAGGTVGGVGGILTRAFTFAITLAGMLAVLIIIWGGFKFMTAQGDEKATSSARGTITGAVIGLIIVLSIAAIGTIISAVFKINVFG